MATRATYQFMTEDQPNQTVYIHNDNYPRGAAEHLQGCSTADELLAKNSRAEITDGHESYGDTEWRYNILKNQNFAISWGDDLGAPHETALSKLYDRPLIIKDWPTSSKAFYMEPFENDATRVKANDVIAPEGYGEIIGGSQRIHDLDLLESRIRENHLPLDAFDW